MPNKYPYELDPDEGDMPKSTAHIQIELIDGEKKKIGLNDYLSIPPPRTRQVDIAKKMIHQQHGIDPATILSIDFFGGIHRKFN